MKLISYSPRPAPNWVSLAFVRSWPAIVVALIALSPLPREAAGITCPDDFAILKYAVCQADWDMFGRSAWSVHPIGLALSAKQFWPESFQHDRVNVSCTLALYVILLVIIQRYLNSSSTLIRGKLAIRRRLVSASLIWSLALSPALSVCALHLTEEIAAAVCVVCLVISTECILVGNARRRDYGCALISSVMLSAVHLYGVLIAVSLLSAVLVVAVARSVGGSAVCETTRPLRWNWLVCNITACIGVVAVNDLLIGGRWGEVLDHYWGHSLFSRLLPVRLVGIHQQLGDIPGAMEAGAVAIVLMVVAVVWVSGRSGTTGFVLVCGLFLFVSLATIEACSGSGILIDQHTTPILVLVFCLVGRLATTSLSPVSTVAATMALLLCGVPGAVSRACDAIESSDAATTLSGTVEDIRDSGDDAVVIAGSRLFFLLAQESPSFVNDSRLKVYTPVGEKRDRSPGRHLVPRALRVNESPMETGGFAACIYVQMSGSQMIRCSISGWSAVWFKVTPYRSLAIHELYVGRLRTSVGRDLVGHSRSVPVGD